MTRFHPESPDVKPEDLSRLRFVADFRTQLHGLARGNRAAYEAEVAPQQPAGGSREARRAHLREAMEKQPFYRAWSTMLRSSQDLMWRYTGHAVDADQDRMALALKSMSNVAEGSVTVDPTVVAPGYLVDADVHRMPGGYAAESQEEDLRAGALYDLGGAIYQLGIGNKTGGLLNDSRGRTLIAHLNARFPDFRPDRILDMGCGVGHNTVPLAAAFPDAETIGIDIGAAQLRYAHLRAEGLGHTVHFIQDNAERTRFADASFDLVVSQIVLHETSPEAAARIVAESRRLLRPGGVAVHIEVPLRSEGADEFQQFMWLWEEYYNAEPNMAFVVDADLVAIAKQAGLADVEMGYQAIPAAGSATSAFTHERTLSQYAHWLIVSGKAP